MSIRARLTLLAAFTVCAFLLVSITETFAVHSILNRVESADIGRRVHRASRLFERRAAAKADVVSEFAFWDDTWTMVDDPGSAVSREHIRENFVEWLPVRYGVRWVEVWNLKNQDVWHSTDSAALESRPNLDRNRFLDSLENVKMLGGYARSDNGLVLVASALILREWDSKMQGRWNGYLVTSQPVDSTLLAELDDELQETLRILPPRDGWPLDSVAVSISSDRDSADVVFALPGLNGESAGLVLMRSSRSFAQQLADSTYLLLLATMLVGILVVALLWRAGNRLVVRPLREIEVAVESMQQEGTLSRLEPVMPTREWRLFVSAFNGMIEALKSSEKRYRVLFDHAADSHFLLDARTHTILEANPAAELLAGCDRQDMIGQPFTAVLRLEPAPDNDGTFRVRRPDGSMLTVGVVTAELEIGGAPRQLASLRDLTRNEALSAQLRQSQKMEAIGSLAGGIAHDFNNLLGAVLMATSTLREEITGNPSAADSIDTIEQASRRAAELTRRLLTFARREQRSITAVAVNEIVNNVVRLCERAFDRAIRIEIECAAELPSIPADAGQVEQAILNLCINSRDAMPAGGVLRIMTTSREVTPDQASSLRDVKPGSYVVITVSDTGMGLTMQAEQHLFEPFFTTKSQGKGTGLGLAMVYGLARTHGGGIHVRNRPGQGVDFELYLPVGDVPTSPNPLSLVTTAPRGTERVLIVDDEPALRSTVRRALSRLGYTADVAENGADGARMVSERPEAYDLVLLDIMMPEMGGAEAFHLIRKARPDMKILVCSGYSADTERRELMESGAAGYLQKPFDILDLAAAVREILDQQIEA